MDIKYKGVSKEDIEKIQKINMPRFSEPVIDYNVMRENYSIINNCIDKIAEREARNGDIYIICEMAKLYLDSLKQEKCCGTCAWYAEFEGVCCCADSEWTADFRCLGDSCSEWTSKEEQDG